MLEEHLGGHAGITHLDPNTLDWLKTLNYKTYLDIGCGPGGMVKLADEKGFEVTGIDGDHTINRYNNNKFIIHDFTTGPAPIDGVFDIGWCVEFVEHVYEKYIPNYMDAMKKCKNLIMTYAPPGWKGHHHVNCQPEIYWVNLLKSNGFILDEAKTTQLRKNSNMYWNKGKKKNLSKFIQDRGLFFYNERI